MLRSIVKAELYYIEIGLLSANMTCFAAKQFKFEEHSCLKLNIEYETSN